jgi:predicted RND superfamily exporter protein
MRTYRPGRVARAHARFVSRRPGVALAVTVGATAVFGLLARDVRLDNNFAALFATSSAEARFREDYRSAFGPDDGLLAAVLSFEGTDGRAADVVHDVTQAVGEIPGVARVNSPTVTEVLMPGSGTPTPAFGPASTLGPADATERLRLARAGGLGTQFLVSGDGRTWLVVGELEADRDSYEEVVGPAERFREVVEERVGHSDADVRAHFAGVAFTRVSAIAQMQSDLLALSPLATLLMALLLAAFFRRPVAVAAPLVAIGLSLVATAGVIGLAGDDLNQVTVIYPILLMGVVVASATHLVHRYYRERAAGRDPQGAARVTVERVLPGAFVANLTSAIGFASLATAHMQVLHRFGLYLAAGVMLAWAIGTTVIPAILVLRRAQPPGQYMRFAAAVADASAPAGMPARGNQAHRTLTHRLARAISGRRSAPALLVAGLAVVGVSAAVASTASYDYALAGMLPAGDPTSVGNRIIDSELAGIIPVEVSLKGDPGAFDDPDILRRADALDAFLGYWLGTRPVGLPALLDDLAAAGVAAAVADPGAALDVAAASRPGALDRLVTPDRGHARLGGFVPDHGGRWVVALRDRVEAEGARLFSGTGVGVRVTGEAPVAYDGMNTLTRELVISTIVALGCIVLAIGLVLRSVGLALVAALPNVVPVVAGMGLYALSSDTLDPLPGLVFCIAAGLAADDTVHLMNRWRELRALDPDGDGRAALVTALVTARAAMVSSTLVLVAGFSSLALSGFGWNRELGVLGSVVLVLSLGSDIVLGTAGLAVYARRRDHRDRRTELDRKARLGNPPDHRTGRPPVAVESRV